MMNVGITGSRTIPTIPQLFKADKLLRLHNPEWMHHGDCTGADEMLHEIALQLGIKTCIHPPTSDKHRAFCEGDVTQPELPYLDRNKKIVDESEMLLAFPDGVERIRSGTWATVRYARLRAIPVAVIMPDGCEVK